MAIARRDDWLTDAQGRALAGAQVFYCEPQPANTSVTPPTPLATVYSSISGAAATNPQITDGFGHAIAYLDDTVLYTIVFVHPLFGSNPVVLTDQAVSGGGGATSLTPFAGIPSGTVDGTNRVFTLTNNGVNLTQNPDGTPIVWKNFPLVLNVGFTISGVTITYAVAPVSTDTLWAQGWLS